MVSEWVFVGDLERAIAGNLLAVLRTAARHKNPDEAFCMGCVVMARADTISIRGNWGVVSGIVRASLDGDPELLSRLDKPGLLEAVGKGLVEG